MSFTRREKLLGYITLGYIALFGAYFVFQGNTEFLWYVAVMVAFLIFIGSTIRLSNFPFGILVGLSIWGLLHMLGGGLALGDGVLYGLTLLPLAEVGDTTVLKYDQFVHAFGFFMATLAMYHLIRIRARPDTPVFGLALIAATAGMGLGALNEVAEFVPVLVLENTGVGGYYNTALDLVFNMIGAFSAAAVLYIRDKQVDNSTRDTNV